MANTTDPVARAQIKVLQTTVTNQQTQIDQQHAQINELSTHVDALQTQVDAIEVPPSTNPVPPGGADIVLKPGDNLLSILAAAPEGAIVSIPPEFQADLSWWQTPKPVTLQSTAALSPSRVGPDTLHGPVLRGLLDAHVPNVVLRGLRLEGDQPEGTLLTTNQNTVIDRCVLLGNVNGQHRGIMANSAGVVIVQTHVGNIWKDQDTQALCGTSGTKNMHVDDCFFEASGETILFGGDDNASDDLTPQDIAISNCHLIKPLSWRGKPGCTVKNHYELKTAKRVTLSKCKMENVWVGGQDGYAIVLTVRNQDGGSPWANIEDCVIEDCQIVGAGAGVNVLGRDYRFPSKIMTGMILRRLTFEDIDPKAWNNPFDGTWGSGRQLFISGGPAKLTVEDCSFKGQNLNSALSFDQPEHLLTDFVYRRNYVQEGQYGVIGTSAPALGKKTLDMYAPGYLWEQVSIQKTAGYYIEYPAGTTVIQ